jgi:carboxyl-terminal processing protease
MPLTHGGAVKLTTSRYFTPSGASIHGKGIIPDIVEDGPEETPAELVSAKQGQQSLAARDKEVRLGLDTLKNHNALIRSPGTPLSVRALVP